MKIDIIDFIELGNKLPIIDVRTPAEFEQGHIPDAINIPLFSNDERAVVGTLYKKRGKDKAVLEGLKIVGPKMYDFVVAAKKASVEGKVLLHCWRGGMRSASMAWLFETAGLKADTLEGGYKAYRSYIRKALSRNQKINILGGMTGSNKTDILLEMQKMGEQVIDLEGEARHRGSSFGQIGLEPQPTNEQFENNIAKLWLNLDPSKTLWLEDESRVMGRVRITEDMFDLIRISPLYILEKTKQMRIQHLVNEYANLDVDELENAIKRIEKRIGGLKLKLAIDALHNRDFAEVANITLDYYDKTYTYGIDQRTEVEKILIESNTADPIENANMILEISKNR
ncbi:MAG: tRNA 2-selenouridine(34) synthase MnmH [Bacteroidales bacterium]|nr:tRNA 2-selenouridine(34) synthase MnmH [Bacteroidales bacterium]